MGDPKRSKRKYETPKNRWSTERIQEEGKLLKKYGLKNHKELWRVRTDLKTKRQNTRKLLGLPLEQRLQREKQLLTSLQQHGLIKEKSTLDDVLSLNIEDFLERRLQSVVWRKGLALTAKQARQFIVHGNIGVNGKRVNAPSFWVEKGIEDSVRFYGKTIELNTADKEEVQKKFADVADVGEKAPATAEDVKDTEAKKGEEAKPAPAENKTLSESVAETAPIETEKAPGGEENGSK